MKKKGLLIHEKNEILDKVSLLSSELRLLASGDGVEIMIHELNPDITFDIYPPDDEDSTLMEFFYVLDGNISYIPLSGEEKILKTGDYFYTKNNKEIYIFKTLSRVKLLYVSSQPVFHLLSESMSELHKINEEIERKDSYTRSHCERVQDLAVKIALEMNLNREMISRIAIAALFHDIGKIFIDDSILNKKDKLTKEEFEKIKTHPLHSANYVKNLKYLDVSDIVRQHHERIDGSGYPYGLKDNEICLEAKIIAVSDTFDAMTSNRPYRKAIDPKLSVQEIKELSGKLYDPEVVKAFINIYNKYYKSS